MDAWIIWPRPEHVAGLNRLPLKDCINQTESEASDCYEQHFSIWNGHCFQKVLTVSLYFSERQGRNSVGNYPDIRLRMQTESLITVTIHISSAWNLCNLTLARDAVRESWSP
jgi:hypothetical protein